MLMLLPPTDSSPEEGKYLPSRSLGSLVVNANNPVHVPEIETFPFSHSNV